MSATRLLSLGMVALLLAGAGSVRADEEVVPPEVKKLLDDYEREAQEIQKKADAEKKAKRAKLVKDLKEIQDGYCKAAKLDEAVAIRDKIRELKGGVSPANVKPDPGVLVPFRAEVGKSFYFKVTGRATGGAVWGSDIYTDDSALSVAAVHAGALKDGQEGIVKVTILKHEGTYDSTTRNGVTTAAFGTYPGSSFRVEAVNKD
jgi:hypothetical protein